MASFLDLSNEKVDDAVKPEAAPAGEYTVKITDLRTDDDGKAIMFSKSDTPYILPILEIVNAEGCEYFNNFSHFLGLPHDGMDAKQKNRCLVNLREFFQAFGIEYGGEMNVEDWLGNEAEAIVGVKDSGEYGEQNFVKTWVSTR
jgi:hypothetical protein